VPIVVNPGPLLAADRAIDSLEGARDIDVTFQGNL